MVRKFLLEHDQAVYQMHDERITDIVIEDNKISFEFLNLCRNKDYSKCTMTFSGFEDMIYDICITVYDINSDLIISGKQYYLEEFISNYYIQGMPLMDVIEIFVGHERVIIKGVLLSKSGYTQKNIVIDITAKELSYFWTGKTQKEI